MVLSNQDRLWVLAAGASRTGTSSECERQQRERGCRQRGDQAGAKKMGKSSDFAAIVLKEDSLVKKQVLPKVKLGESSSPLSPPAAHGGPEAQDSSGDVGELDSARSPQVRQRDSTNAFVHQASSIVITMYSSCLNDICMMKVFEQVAISQRTQCIVVFTLFHLFEHKLKSLEAKFMKIIYIKWLKKWILDDIEIPVYSIKVYHLPEEESVEDEGFKDETGPLKSRIPIFIVGSN
ncbi:hypothetical protein QTO34_001404 [Cnephaeus nilssonii]|uniref:Uncharacterized protein n=1 Tax=Cnephaeus nilssonii TaxID=3371016 RepID=A0AA40HVT4_CNENI|nr:hypothetical protein QTO34_001404 [Eptesicus nilssonii]